MKGNTLRPVSKPEARGPGGQLSPGLPLLVGAVCACGLGCWGLNPVGFLATKPRQLPRGGREKPSNRNADRTPRGHSFRPSLPTTTHLTAEETGALVQREHAAGSPMASLSVANPVCPPDVPSDHLSLL